MKLCKDCKWHRSAQPPLSASFDECGHGQALPDDWRHIVTGEPLPPFCTAARNQNGGCKHEGDLFEPKETV